MLDIPTLFLVGEQINVLGRLIFMQSLVGQRDGRDGDNAGILRVSGTNFQIGEADVSLAYTLPPNSSR